MAASATVAGATVGKSRDQANKDEYRRHLVDARHAASQDYDRAVLTLSSATLALSVTFLHDIAPTPKPGSTTLVVLSWLCLGGALVLIFASLLTSRWSLERALDDHDANKPEEPQRPGGRLAVTTEVLNVLAGVGVVAGFVFLAWFALINV